MNIVISVTKKQVHAHQLVACKKICQGGVGCAEDACGSRTESQIWTFISALCLWQISTGRLQFQKWLGYRTFLRIERNRPQGRNFATRFHLAMAMLTRTAQLCILGRLLEGFQVASRGPCRSVACGRRPCA